ncbi:unnamed protein product [Tuber melanosporum]|uniref:(Perigord truffle) hypothetical protein n=1 Tax=Tuber melanosporum (strain Mel28) TaxID=656061 RepID=D5GJ59_TUBMM|nr:uncharacterized protein GSTUM_00008849001 [Tuber melanosporum]CAZ84552.1 unnamed protein product [Tuber melanosporum]
MPPSYHSTFPQLELHHTSPPSTHNTAFIHRSIYRTAIIDNNPINQSNQTRVSQTSKTEMSLRFIPPATSTPATLPAPTASAPSAASIPDTLRAGGPTSLASTLNSRHPLEARLAQWDETQEKLKMENLRRMFGVQEVIRRGMEIKIAGSDWRPAQLGGPSNFHLDILRGVDERIEWEDVFKGNDNTFEMPDFHVEMERKLRMNW